MAACADAEEKRLFTGMVEVVAVVAFGDSPASMFVAGGSLPITITFCPTRILGKEKFCIL